jgi:hypothetical protein
VPLNQHFVRRAALLLPTYVGTTDRESSGMIGPIRATCTPYTPHPFSVSHALSKNVPNLPAYLNTSITDPEHFAERLTRREAPPRV